MGTPSVPTPSIIRHSQSQTAGTENRKYHFFILQGDQLHMAVFFGTYYKGTCPGYATVHMYSGKGTRKTRSFLTGQPIHQPTFPHPALSSKIWSYRPYIWITNTNLNTLLKFFLKTGRDKKIFANGKDRQMIIKFTQVLDLHRIFTLFCL